MPKLGTSKSEIKRDLVCRGCGASWKYTGISTRTECPYCGKHKDVRMRKDKRYPTRPMNFPKKDSAKNSRIILKKRAFFMIAKTNIFKCVRCGCDDFRMLEINHKKGGGSKERKESGGGSWKFLMDIANGTRNTDDLELLCKPCNAIHYLEIKYGKIPMRVLWKEEQNA